MKAAYFLLIVAGVIIFAVILVFAAVRSEDKSRLSRKEKKELNELRDLVAVLDTLAYQHRDLDSALAVQILDEINKTRRMLR